ncbi:hypothetical protein ABZ746_09685 [Streptomyces sp. NPDC020096]
MGPVLVAIVLVAWVACTVLASLPKIGKVVRARIPAWFSPLLPSWTFFAPSPATRDRALFYRDLLDNGVGPLREVWPQGAPGGRAAKAVADASSHLLELVIAAHDDDDGSRTGRSDDDGRKAGRSRDAELMMSTAYLLLLGRAVAAEHDASAVGVQFVIALTSLRDEEPQVLFISAAHQLEPRHGAWPRPGASPAPGATSSPDRGVRTHAG